MGMPSVYALLHARLGSAATGAIELRVKSADKGFSDAVLAAIVSAFK